MLFWLAIDEPKRQVSMSSLLVLLLFLSLAFTLDRWKPRSRIEVERAPVKLTDNK